MCWYNEDLIRIPQIKLEGSVGILPPFINVAHRAIWIHIHHVITIPQEACSSVSDAVRNRHARNKPRIVSGLPAFFCD